MIGWFSPDLLRRHVADRAHHVPGIGSYLQGGRIPRICGHFGAGKFRQAKVQDFDSVVVGYEQVLRLEIPMNDPLLMCRCEPAGDLQSIVRSLSRT